MGELVTERSSQAVLCVRTQKAWLDHAFCLLRSELAEVTECETWSPRASFGRLVSIFVDGERHELDGVDDSPRVVRVYDWKCIMMTQLRGSIAL